LSARGLKQARQGTIFAAYLKLAPVFIFLIPGMIAVALFKQKYPGFESIGENPQAAFPTLVSNLLPIGLRGLVLAGMLSALMSALASLFNSTATLFTVDFYKRLRPQSSEQHLVRVGRFATAAVVVIGMARQRPRQDVDGAARADDEGREAEVAAKRAYRGCPAPEARIAAAAVVTGGVVDADEHPARGAEDRSGPLTFQHDVDDSLLAEPLPRCA
jgi:hypothetical protein